MLQRQQRRDSVHAAVGDPPQMTNCSRLAFDSRAQRDFSVISSPLKLNSFSSAIGVAYRTQSGIDAWNRDFFPLISCPFDTIILRLSNIGLVWRRRGVRP